MVGLSKIPGALSDLGDILYGSTSLCKASEFTGINKPDICPPSLAMILGDILWLFNSLL